MGKLLFIIVIGLIVAPPSASTNAPVKYSASNNVVKPVKLTWEMLFKVVLVEQYSARYKMKINVPDFDYTLKDLNNKEVVIEGFVIPTGVSSNTFVLSQNPYSACYFCGNGGVETVMTIKYSGIAPKFKTDDYIKLKGIFELNSTNINELIYVLNKASQLK